MLALLDQGNGPFSASDADARLARDAVAKLSPIVAAKQGAEIVVQQDVKVTVPLPAQAVSVILTVLEHMAKQEPISIIPHQAELTTQQAADYLNVSRPYLIKLLDDDQISHRKVGRHRRVKYADLIAFERKTDGGQFQALAEMADEARRLNLK